jgi:hypothetical protein
VPPKDSLLGHVDEVDFGGGFLLDEGDSVVVGLGQENYFCGSWEGMVEDSGLALIPHC